MRLAQTRIRTRTAFTLIELLVVIAIIAVLVSLTAAAVMKALSKGPELQANSEVRQMDASMATCKNELFGGTANPPSRIKLGFTPAAPCYDLTQQLDVDSINWIKRTFPHCYDTWASQGIAWGPGVVANQPGVTLEGEQCLVFFLGGIQTYNPNGCLGFSTNPLNPAMAGGGRKGPYYEFKSSRLVPGPNGFLVFNDPYGTPYAYFSSYKARNNYNRYGISPADCPSLGSLQPYYSSTTPPQYYNPDTFQIISAGADKTFGPGGLWTAQNPVPQAGQDDISNFSGKRLGAGPQ
jgi:prepilin-type N-terminal cleavage/methylation domain-containing protein